MRTVLLGWVNDSSKHKDIELHKLNNITGKSEYWERMA